MLHQLLQLQEEIGPRQWKKESGYHRQARVENTFYRYKSIIASLALVIG